MNWFSILLILIRVVAICLFVFIDLQSIGLGCVLLFIGLVFGYRKSKEDFICFSHFILDKILYFALLITLIENSVLNVAIVVWLVVGEFIDSGSRLLLVSKNLVEKDRLGSLIKNYIFLLLVSLLYGYRTVEAYLTSYQGQITYIPFITASVLIIMTAYYVYRNLTHKMLQSLFQESK